MASAPYDGFICAATNGGQGFNARIIINDVYICVASNADYGNNSVGEVAFRKGDKIELSGNFSGGYRNICFYEKRDYSNR